MAIFKKKISFVSLYFAKPSTACISGTTQPIFLGLSAKCGIKNASYNYVEN